MDNKIEPNDEIVLENDKPANKEVTTVKVKAKKPTLLEKLKNWCESSTAHGMVKLAKRDHVIGKLYWSICILVSWSMLAYLTTKTIMEYLEFDYIVGIELKYERPSRFPAVDICSLSPYTKAKPKFNVTSLQFPDLMAKRDKADIFIIDALNQYESKLSSIELKYLAHDFKSIVLSCKIQRKPCNLDTDFIQYHNYYFGNCFRFNGHNKLEYNEPGLRYGLQLELYTDPHNNTLSSRTGFVLLIHDQAYNDFAYPEDNGIMISPGFETNIAFSRKLIENLPWPYNDCMGDLNDPVFDYLVKQSKKMRMMKHELKETKYNQNKCIKLCFQHYIIEKCNCYLYHLPKLNHHRINGCSNIFEEICAFKAEEEFFNSDMDQECYKQCPDSCTQTIYDYKTSFSKYPSDWYLSKFYDNYSKTEIKNLFENHIAVANIYSDMVYTHIYQSPFYTPISLFATLGGNVGLLGGWSVLTIMESFDLIADLLF